MSFHFTLNTDELANTEAKAVAVNKRAAKAGITAEVTVHVLETREVSTESEFGFTKTYDVHEVEILGLSDVKLAGWQLAAVLDHGEGGNIFRTVPGFEVEIPAEFRGTDAERCDHCGLRRNRNETILVWSEAEGFKQVGSSCVKLFLGVGVAAILAFAAELESFGEFEGGSGRCTNYTTSEFVSAAALVTAVYGFRPSSFDPSTKEVAYMLITNLSEAGKVRFAKECPELVNPSAKDVAKANALAAEATAWIAESSESSDYICNLRIAAGRKDLGRNAGLLASLPNAYKRAQGQLAEREAKAAIPASVHVGQVGDKVEVTGTVIYTNRSEGYTFGSPESLFAIVRSEAGEVFYVSTTVVTQVGEFLEDASKTQVVTIKGSIKAHKTTGKGEAVTVLTRCKPVG